MVLQTLHQTPQCHTHRCGSTIFKRTPIEVFFGGDFPGVHLVLYQIEDQVSQYVAALRVAVEDHEVRPALHSFCTAALRSSAKGADGFEIPLVLSSL